MSTIWRQQQKHGSGSGNRNGGGGGGGGSNRAGWLQRVQGYRIQGYSTGPQSTQFLTGQQKEQSTNVQESLSRVSGCSGKSEFYDPGEPPVPFSGCVCRPHERVRSFLLASSRGLPLPSVHLLELQSQACFILNLCWKEDALSLAVWCGNSLQLEEVQQDLYLIQKQIHVVWHEMSHGGLVTNTRRKWIQCTAEIFSCKTSENARQCSCVNLGQYLWHDLEGPAVSHGDGLRGVRGNLAVFFCWSE